jgi:hypothetical protein
MIGEALSYYGRSATWSGEGCRVDGIRWLARKFFAGWAPPAAELVKRGRTRMTLATVVSVSNVVALLTALDLVAPRTASTP